MQSGEVAQGKGKRDSKYVAKGSERVEIRERRKYTNFKIPDSPRD